MAPRKRKRRYPKKHKAFIDQYRHLYDEMLEEQGGGCAICHAKPKEGRRLHFDHEHKEPMHMRGLLCFPCNRRIPVGTDAAWFRAAADYLEYYEV